MVISYHYFTLYNFHINTESLHNQSRHKTIKIVFVIQNVSTATYNSCVALMFPARTVYKFQGSIQRSVTVNKELTFHIKFLIII
jgi:hypothetical protein